VRAYIHRLHLSIDYALAISYRRNAHDGNARFVARITLVKGIPFYGYHVGYQFYLKIYMLNPIVMTRLADLLRQGVIMKRIFQPYEAHLQYLLQWMADYNLYGCGYIDCSKVSFRNPVPRHEEISSSMHLWHDHSIPSQIVTDEALLPRVSHCSIEVDICVQDILNRGDIKPRPIHHNFVELREPLDLNEKLVPSMAELWKDETRRRKAKLANADSGSSPFPAEVMFSMSADPRHSQPGGWIHESEHREMVDSLIQEERNGGADGTPSFETFVQSSSFESSVKTSLEAVEDLYPENLQSVLALPGEEEDGRIDNTGVAAEREVDEKRLVDFGAGMNDETYDSDEDVMQEIELSQKKNGDQIDKQQLTASNLASVHNKPLDENLSSDHFRNLESSEDSWSDPPKAGILSIGVERPLISSPLSPSQSNSPDAISFSQRERMEEGNYVSIGLKRAQQHDDQLSNKRQKSSINLTGGNAISQYDDKEDHHRRSSMLPTLPTPPVLSNPESFSKRHVVGTNPSRAKSSSQESLNFPLTKDPHDTRTVFKSTQSCLSPENLSAKKRVSLSSLPATSSKLPRLFGLKGSSSGLFTEGPTSKVVVKMLDNVVDAFGATRRLLLPTCHEPPPSSNSVLTTISHFNLPSVLPQDPYYSNEADVPERPREWAGREFKLGSTTLPFLPLFDPTGISNATFDSKTVVLHDRTKEEESNKARQQMCSLRSWTFAESPPSYAEVEKWAHQESEEVTKSRRPFATPRPVRRSGKKGKLSQIDGPTQKNNHGFKYTQHKKTKNIQCEAQYMSIMSLEVHVNTRGNFVPNPEEDEVQCIFWSLQTGDLNSDSNPSRLGVVVLSEDNIMAEKISNLVQFEVYTESSELDVLVRMVEIVREHDPDILTGYEVHSGSWGYLIERARTKYDYDLCDEFSRMKVQSHGRFGKENDKWGFNNTSTIRVTGRHMINIWRAMRGELNLLQYTLENVAFHLLHQRIPHYSWADLRSWYTSKSPRDLSKLVAHYITRVQLNLEILEANELVSRTSEQARLLGVDFFSVFSRGSQFKVESLMFRIAKPENFILISPSRKQIGSQNALECLPLVMEPQSAFYSGPVLVLDFQSLYPSVMIAYNYCYSTYLGRVASWRGTNKMGFTEYKRQERLLELLKDHINIAPNGMMYAKPEIRKSLLAKMLGEILETRVMVKSGMKADKEDKALQRLLNNRQLALKLIANVTYGYTSASFSGRMPCSEIADSIVQTGRETLEKAIALIHSVKRWGAEVVYGDTDSLFIYLKGRSKDEAFDIGSEIAKTVTNMNPRPVKLKFEKVYLPCVLLAKKRYVGFKYESKTQVEPDFDAKGIETVRRDGTPAEQKIEERALKLLFRTADLSQVKSYFQEQCEKIMKGSVSIQDFCFAREVKLGTYSDKGPPPPGALISTKRMLEDARAEPQYGERVPYVVITGAPGARLIDRCVSPEELLNDDRRELDAEYYISKNLIPPLERIFNLMGANVRKWYDEMPKVQRVRKIETDLPPGQSKELVANKKILESYMKSSSCLVCKEKLESEGSICSGCLLDRPTSMLSLRTRLNVEEKSFLDIQKICQTCSGLSPLEEVRCDSKDCPVFYTRTKQKARLRRERALAIPALEALSQADELEVDLTDLEW
jgi:DNA polymerase zeta